MDAQNEVECFIWATGKLSTGGKQQFRLYVWASFLIHLQSGACLTHKQK